MILLKALHHRRNCFVSSGRQGRLLRQQRMIERADIWHRRNQNLLARSYNMRLSENDPLKEIVNPTNGKRYPNFPKTLHQVREWNGELFSFLFPFFLDVYRV